MAKCQFCDKGVAFGIQVSHSHRRSNRTWKPNVKRVKAIVDGSPKHVYACTRCLRSGKVTRAVYLPDITRNKLAITASFFRSFNSAPALLKNIFYVSPTRRRGTGLPQNPLCT